MANPGFFRNVLDSIAASRSKRAERAIARYVETQGYRKLLNEDRSRHGF